MELEKAQKIAAEVIKRLSPYCQRIEVAGSIRRRKAIVHDIDIVLIPSDAWNLEGEVLALASPFQPKMSGEKLKRFDFKGAQIDLYYATVQTWATLFLIRTGSTENNIRLCSLAKQKGWHLAASGDGLFDETGKRIAGDSEESIYKALGLPYQRPEEREPTGKSNPMIGSEPTDERKPRIRSEPSTVRKPDDKSEPFTRSNPKKKSEPMKRSKPF